MTDEQDPAETLREPLTIARGKHTLTVKPKPEGFDLEGFDITVTGGPNITQDEYDQIAAHVGDAPGSELFLVGLQIRMKEAER